MSDFQNNDPLIIGGVELQSRLFIGTGKYSNDASSPTSAPAAARR